MRSRKNVHKNVRRRTRRRNTRKVRHLRKRGGDKELLTMSEIQRQKAAKTLQRYTRKQPRLSKQLAERLRWARQ